MVLTSFVDGALMQEIGRHTHKHNENTLYQDLPFPFPIRTGD
jgi:hypothetical protein